MYDIMHLVKNRTLAVSIVIAIFTISIIISPFTSGMNEVFAKKHREKNHNSSDQGIGQSQSSRQNSQCVAGGSLSSSCNNLSFQNQDNSGNNAAAQDGGNNGHGKNSGDQGIGQSQSSDQNAQCVSGEDAIVSCNNAEFQRQVNSGNNALGQI